MIRFIILLTFLAVPLFIVVGICNSWAAWAPPGNQGNNFEYYQAASRFYFGCSLAASAIFGYCVFKVFSKND